MKTHIHLAGNEDIYCISQDDPTLLRLLITNTSVVKDGYLTITANRSTMRLIAAKLTKALEEIAS